MSLLILAGLGACLYAVCLTVYRIVLSPLSRFPGPKLAASTWWYEFYFEVIKHGQYYKEIERMHTIYGPIVRINPIEIHISDPEWYDELYPYASGGRRRDKSAWYLTKTAGGSMFATIPHDHHRLRRAALNPFFSKGSVTTIESMIHDKINRLCGTLRASADTGTPVEIMAAFMALTSDIISHYAFGRSFDILEQPDRWVEWKKAMLAAVDAGIVLRYLPWLAQTVKSLPESVASSISAPAGFFFKLEHDVRLRLKESFLKIPTDRKTQRTIFHDLMDSSLPASEKTVERLKDEGIILMGAGTETTAHTLAVLTFHLLHRPDTLKPLKTELYDAIPDADSIPRWQQLEQLPYLRATILEAHRIAAVITARLIRVAPDEDLRYHDWLIPRGTEISMSTYFAHQNPDIFPEPLKFLPERWLDGVEANKQHILPFSKGSRACIGIHLANAELCMTVATIFRRFNLELFETTSRDIEVTRDGFAGGFPPGSKGIRVNVFQA